MRVAICVMRCYRHYCVMTNSMMSYAMMMSLSYQTSYVTMSSMMSYDKSSTRYL